MSPPSAPDLRVEQPRAMPEELDGYVYLPRLIDKARAKAAGTLGDFAHPCPVDHTCLARLGVRPGTLAAIVAAAPDDAGVLAGLRAHGIPSAEEARFDPLAVEHDLQTNGYGVRPLRVEKLPTGASASTHELVGADHGTGVTLILVDAPPGTGPGLHTHPYDEVLVVQEGEATFRFGLAERIVGPGEIVIVSAGQAHAFTNTGDGPLRQLDIHCSPAFETTWLQRERAHQGEGS